jgi:hypothetical protein
MQAHQAFKNDTNFRGLLQQKLRKHMAKLVAIMCCAVLLVAAAVTCRLSSFSAAGGATVQVYSSINRAATPLAPSSRWASNVAALARLPPQGDLPDSQIHCTNCWQPDMQTVSQYDDGHGNLIK